MPATTSDDSPTPGAKRTRRPPSDDAAPRDYYSIAEAAALLGVSRVTIWRWIATGRLPAARLGHRTVRVTRADLDRAMVRIGPANGRHPAVGPASAAVDALGERECEGDSGDGAGEHFVQFYETDAVLLDAVAAFIGATLHAGDAGIVVATAAHREGVAERLAAAGLDLAAVDADGRYIALDAAETLARFTVDGTPDAARFAEVIGEIIARAAAGGRRVRIFGEMVALLTAAGSATAALRLEELWNGLQEAHAFSLFCAYPLDRLGSEALAELLGEISATHTRVIPAESYMALPTPDDQFRAITVLQQKARWLEVEVAERKRVEAELRQREEDRHRLAAIVESSDDAIIGKTLDGIITSWNAGAGRMYGYSAAEAVGQPIAMLIPADRPDELPSIMARLRRGERIDHYETERVRKDGTRLTISLTISPIYGSAGAIVGASAIARDITDRKAAAAALQEQMAAQVALNAALRETAEARDQALAAAQAALRVRDEFLASVSHDLRTPLGAIKGLTQLVLRQAERAPTLDSARVAALLADVNSSATKMAAMIDQLLDVTRLEHGRPPELNRQDIDLVALARQVVAEHQRGTRAHHLTVEAAEPELLGSWDPTQLDRVVSNLLSNAIKYSPAGGTITVGVAREEADGGVWATLTVLDEGIGIPAADLPHIFERFHRGSNVAGRMRGVGIGLAGSKQIVEQHGGAITVASVEGTGTTVTVRLPCILSDTGSDAEGPAA
jgi:PAS domain S-box-containing protein/excisionase family DNA binding protein